MEPPLWNGSKENWSQDEQSCVYTVVVLWKKNCYADHCSWLKTLFGQWTAAAINKQHSGFMIRVTSVTSFFPDAVIPQCHPVILLLFPNHVQRRWCQQPRRRMWLKSVIVIKEIWKSPHLNWGYLCVFMCFFLFFMCVHVFVHCVCVCMCGQSGCVCVPRKTQLLTTSFNRMENTYISYGDTKCNANFINTETRNNYFLCHPGSDYVDVPMKKTLTGKDNEKLLTRSRKYWLQLSE